jgi:hypothetical protein
MRASRGSPLALLPPPAHAHAIFPLRCRVKLHSSLVRSTVLRVIYSPATTTSTRGDYVSHMLVTHSSNNYESMLHPFRGCPNLGLAVADLNGSFDVGIRFQDCRSWVTYICVL